MIIISLVVTAIVYLFFPIFYIKTKGKVPNKKAWRLAFINFIICHAIFLLIILLLHGDVASATAPGLWLFVGQSILAEKKDTNSNKKNNTDNNSEKFLDKE